MQAAKFFLLGLLAFISLMNGCVTNFTPDFSTDPGSSNTLPTSPTGGNMAVADLPPPILNYINANYPGQSVTGAAIEYNNVYIVSLSNGWELSFSPDTNIIHLDKGENGNGINIPFLNLPPLALQYIANNYANYLIADAEFDAASGNFEVWLNSGIKLYFSQSGNFLLQENEFDIQFANLTLPTSALVGQTISLSGILNNSSINSLNQQIKLKYAFVNGLPANLQTIIPDGEVTVGIVNIAAGANTPFTLDLVVNPQNNTGTETYDIAVVWPDVVGVLNVVVLGNGGYATTNIFVQNP